MKNNMTAICLFLAISLFAQNEFIIENVRVFDGEKTIENANVLVESGIITEVSKTNITNIKVQRLDGSNKTLLPALTNAHVHVWSQFSLNEAAKAGVLNVLDMHGVEQMQGMLRTYKDSTNYANFYAAGAAATAPEGHGTQFGFPSPTLTKPEDAKQFISDRVSGGADYIKIIVEPWKKTLNHDTVKALIEEAHIQDRVAVVHISKAEDAYQVLKNDANGLVHIWWDKLLPEEQLRDLIVDKQFFVIPTLLTSILATESIKKGNPDAQFLSEAQLKSEVKRLYDAGATILAGTDPPNVNINYGTDLYKELKLISEAGIPNEDVLKAATSATAKAFGLKNSGRIAKGFKADMILVDGNPLENIEAIGKIEIVWKHGKLVKR